MIKTIKQQWKQSGEDPTHKLLMESLTAKNEWEINPLDLAQVKRIKEIVKFCAISFATIGFILGSIIF